MVFMECFFAPPSAHFPSAEYCQKKLYLNYVFFIEMFSFYLRNKKINN